LLNVKLLAGLETVQWVKATSDIWSRRLWLCHRCSKLQLDEAVKRNGSIFAATI